MRVETNSDLHFPPAGSRCVVLSLSRGNTAMKLVNENSESDIKKRAASKEFEQKLESLAINMLRVIAGAGRPARLLQEIHECALATQTYREAHSQSPSAFQVSKLLDIDKHDEDEWDSWTEEQRRRWEADGTFMIQTAAARIRRASLRIVAAQWAGQRTVLINAEHLFSDGIERYIKAREFRLKAWLKR